jgi:hypothetical protein
MMTEPRRDLRIAWSPRLGCDLAIDADVLAALQRQVDALRAAGWSVDDADPRWPAGVREYPLLSLQQAGLHALYGQRLAAERDIIDPNLVAQIEAGASWTAADIARVLRLRERIVAGLSRFFDEYDLLLCPTAGDRVACRRSRARGNRRHARRPARPCGIYATIQLLPCPGMFGPGRFGARSSGWLADRRASLRGCAGHAVCSGIGTARITLLRLKSSAVLQASNRSASPITPQASITGITPAVNRNSAIVAPTPMSKDGHSKATCKPCGSLEYQHGDDLPVTHMSETAPQE